MPHQKYSPLRLLTAAVLAAVLFFALRAGFAAADGLQTLCGGRYGLRAAAPLDDAQRENARRAAAALDAGIAFWGESTDVVRAQNGAAKAEAKVIVCEGEPALALGAHCLYGRAPAAAENGVCMVSLPLAQALWGAADVTGQTLVWQDTAYTVCGAAAGEGLWLLCPAPAGIPLTAVELAGLPAGDPRAAAQGVAAAAGLGQDAVLVPEGTLAAAAGLLAWLPLALAGLTLAGRAAALIWRRLGPGAARQTLLFGAALLLASALPAVLAALPAWLIPNRWSDFDFWRALCALPARTLQDILSAPPSVRDTTLQRLLVQAAAACTAALSAAAVAMRRRSEHGSV